ncbi:tyrosine-type recombinase/integrase [Occultella gossypii]|uniref:Tyrosine-type recombinase/integrase n=1 Tax=Occultella gossypii TaxID=2800820 RepID=A0ABS7SA69_9MICO|nr:tyrosine-type recombinase/integrase [Occultella gossypii]MBZ2197238.1 tyrosine-type recombinase/integrase [Occultella gossypii]
MPKIRSHGDGGLYELKSRGLWRGVLDLGYDADGKRIQKSVHAKTKTECRNRLDELKAEIAKHGAPLNKQVTLKAWSATWLQTVAKVNVDPKTYSTYASVTRRWIIPTLGTKQVATLKPSDVRALRTAIVDVGKRSAATARTAHIVLSMMLDAAHAERLCATNVAATVKKPTGAKVERGALPTPEALAILRAAAALPDSAGSRWWFKLLGGQRQGEILGATLADLDLDGGYYVVNWKLEEIPRDHGCGGTCGKKRGAACPDAVWRIPDGFELHHVVDRWHLTRPKSKTGRAVPLGPELVEAIRRHIAATETWPNPYGLIWRNRDGSPILPKDDAAQWRDLLQVAGVIAAADNRPGGTAMTGHLARHTTVTILASLGYDHQLIGEIVGHSSTKVTEIYRHAQAAEKRAAMDALGGVWAEALQLPAT